MASSLLPCRSPAEVAEILDDLPQRQRREYGRSRVLRAKPVKEIVAQVVTRHGLGRILASEELADAWQDIVGVEIAAHSRPGAIRSGKLEIIVTHSAFKQELQYQESRIVAQLVQEAPALAIRGIRFRVGTMR